MSTMSRFLLVDPQPFFCEALAVGLARVGAEVVGWSTDERDAARLAATRRPDVVLTELELDQGSGLSLMRRLRGEVPTVALTRLPEGEVLLDIATAGGLGCLSHDLSVDTVATRADLAASRVFAVAPERLHDALVTAARVARAGRSDPLARLSGREREVLSLLAEGLDNHAIGDRLHLSTHTIRTHVGNILKKLRVHSRAEAARLALRADPRAEGVSLLRIHGPDLYRR